MPRVFISHASEDRELVETQVIAPLRAAGLDTWYSSDDIQGSQKWARAIRDALNTCDWFLVALSPASVRSRYVQSEVEIALQAMEERVVPVLIRECDPADCHFVLSTIQHVDLRRDLVRGQRALLAVFRVAHGNPRDANADDDLGNADPSDSGSGAHLAKLRSLRQKPDVREVPWLFRILASPKRESDRRRCQQILDRMGWGEVEAAVMDLARRGDLAVLRDVLAGLQTIQATPALVTTLDRVLGLLAGDVRNQFLLAKERKKASLETDRVRDLFGEKHSSYEVEKLLGQGLFTTTYLGRHKLDPGHKVAIRVLREEYAVRDDVRLEYLDLAARAKRYQNDRLLLTRDVGQFAADRVYFTIRDYVDSDTLQNALEARVRPSPSGVVAIVKQLLEALSPVHRAGHVHAGVRPSNVFRLAVTEIRLGDPRLSLSHVPRGVRRLSYDLLYAAPEWFKAGAVVGPPADLYSLGCLLYELLSGHPPFRADDPDELLNLHRVQSPSPLEQTLGAGGGWDALLGRLLHKNPSSRFASAMDALDQLDGFALPPPGGEDLTAGSPEESLPDLRPEFSVIAIGGAAGDFGTVSTRSSLSRHISEGDANGIQVGTLLDRRYKVVRVIGGGGMGTVYEVEHTHLRTSRALKLIKSELARDAGYRQRFFNEARWMNEAQHPHIVAVHDFQEDPDHGLFLVMELIRGPNLKTLLQQRGPLPLGEVLRIGREIAGALDHVHRLERIHRDIKPANILIEDGTGRAVVTDFGIAGDLSASGEDALTGTLEVVATLNYASPEQLGGDSDLVDQRSDLFALGTVLYEMYAGRHYGGMGAVSRLRYPVAPPPEFASVVRACLELDMEKRPASAAEVLRLLESCPVPEESAADTAALGRGRDVHPTPPEADQSSPDADPGTARAGAMRAEPLAPASSPDDTGAGRPGQAPCPRLVPEGTVHEREVPRPLDENVQFTVYRPKAIHAERWYPFLVFAHLDSPRPDADPRDPDPRDEVARRARLLLADQSPEYRTLTQESRQAVPRQGKMTVVPEIPGVEFNPPRCTFRWIEAVHWEEFRMRAPASVEGRVLRGRVSVLLGSVIIAEISVRVHVEHHGTTLATKVEAESASAGVFRRIFASYSHRDSHIVNEFARYARALGDEYLLDVTHLRAGEVWSDRLARMIEEADVFQLFWSRNSMVSPFVRREWELALEQRKEIRPVYWEDPLPTSDDLPPPSLRALHFLRIAPPTAVAHFDAETPPQPTPGDGESPVGRAPGAVPVLLLLVALVALLLIARMLAS